MKTKSIILAALVLLFFTSCEKSILCEKGKGAEVTQTLELPPIEGLSLCIAANVNLTYGEEQSISVTGQQNIIDNLKLDVDNDVWIIDGKKCMNYKKDLVIDITLPTLKEVKISGAGDVRSTNHFPEQGDLTLGISGAGDLDLSIDALALTSKISGAGDIVLEGTATSADHKVSGSGDVAAFEFPTADVDVKISGAGNMKVNATETLDVVISGSGDVYYKGNPTMNVDISGAGDIHNAN